MIKNRKSALAIIIGMVFVLSGCFTSFELTKENFAKLPNNKFILTGIAFKIRCEKDFQTSYFNNHIKNTLPLAEITSLLEKEYGIKIDSQKIMKYIDNGKAEMSTYQGITFVTYVIAPEDLKNEEHGLSLFVQGGVSYSDERNHKDGIYKDILIMYAFDFIFLNNMGKNQARGDKEILIPSADTITGARSGYNAGKIDRSSNKKENDAILSFFPNTYKDLLLQMAKDAEAAQSK